MKSQNTNQDHQNLWIIYKTKIIKLNFKIRSNTNK